MYLKKLSSNKEQFHTVEFKKGLNFIVGRRKDPNIKELKETYNGVGKSLIIELIHFCLGSSKIEVFEENLKGWTFTLEFEIYGEEYRVTRECEKQDFVSVNSEIMKVSKYTNLLAEKVFGLSNVNKISNVSFRSLISRFIRRYKSSYNKYNTYIAKEKDYAKLVNNAFLLGIDTNLIQSKMKQKKEMAELQKTKKIVEKDPILKEYFVGNEDLDIEITDLKDEIKNLEIKISEFKVAENYRNIQEQADKISYLRKELSNKSILIDNSIRKIDKSLEIKPDIELETILKMYDEANIIFNDKVTKNLEEVTQFHNKLLENRVIRLKSQKQNLLKIKEGLEEQIKSYEIQLNKLIKFLGNHGALEEFAALNDKLSDLKLKLEKASDYKNLMETYEEKLANAKIINEQQKLEANRYIKENKQLLEQIMNTFRGYSKVFYKDKPSGLEVKVNDGENQLRFEINAKIIGDSSDGISEVCIFCFDMTLLKLRNHKVKFLFHDSRLFANMDPRQRLSLLKIVEEETNEANIQYIASLNEDLILSLEDIVDEEEYKHYKNLIEENTILVLTDKSDEDKLLGMTKDIAYDK
ncbi:DUF2326 domain-containing protein [uncultured Clostridium sp.]|uniref:DUF2326 domain-containing protein n=2 Tax=Clostridium TaxID=1485 RepID=UPI00266F80FF|nr:DUF2326 domain-containing protein [uncultured Clostridium sp.]